MQFSDFERQQLAALKQKELADLNSVTCRKCGSKFFEQIEVGQFSTNHQLVLGQEIPPKPGTMPYRFLRCVVCQNVIEPMIQNVTRDLAGGDYDLCLDTLEGKFDARKKEEVKVDNAIQSEEL